MGLGMGIFIHSIKGRAMQTQLDKQLEKQLPNVFGFKPKYRLRWRFDFANGTKKIGPWNGNSPHHRDMAFSIKKDGLVRAFIEGEKVGEWVIKPMLEVDGHMYASAQWQTAAGVSPFGTGEYTAKGRIIGLSLLTNDEKLTVFVDGRGERRPLTAHEKQFQITEHSFDSGVNYANH